MPATTCSCPQGTSGAPQYPNPLANLDGESEFLVVELVPPAWEEAFAPSGIPRIGFNRPVDVETLRENLSLVDESGEEVAVTMRVGEAGTTVELVPAWELEGSSDYALLLFEGLADDQGVPLTMGEGDDVVFFTTTISSDVTSVAISPPTVSLDGDTWAGASVQVVGRTTEGDELDSNGSGEVLHPGAWESNHRALRG